MHEDIKMIKQIIILTALLLFLQYAVAASAQAEPEKEKPTVGELFRFDEVQHHRIIKQPNGPFAAIIFNEDALAIHACIIYYDNMGNPKNEKWDISERTWCSRKWGSDITSLYWCPNGKCLYIGTSLVYGDGGVFRLDLYSKKVTKVYPPANLNPTGKEGKKYVSSTEIIGAIKDKLKIKVGYAEIAGDTERDLGEKTETIPLKQ
jgi:hypothetical protein